MVYAATGAGVEAEEVAETKLHRIQGSALRWPLFIGGPGEAIRNGTILHRDHVQCAQPKSHTSGLVKYEGKGSVLRWPLYHVPVNSLSWMEMPIV